MFSAMLVLCWAVVGCGRDGTRPAAAMPSEELQGGWKNLASPPSDAQRACAQQAGEVWRVSRSDGQLQVDPWERRIVQEPLPFDIPSADDRRGNRHVLQLSDGWLVGFDAGEWGGGLWWFGPEGEGARRLRPPEAAWNRNGAGRRLENVRGFAVLDDAIFVFLGLDHLMSRSGGVFRLDRRDGEWKLVPIGLLDASPDVWLTEEGRVLIVTEGGLWSLHLDGPLEQVHRIDLSSLLPTSVVRGTEGALYLGLQHYLVRLEPKGGDWTASWLAPDDCTWFEIDDSCRCLS